MKENIIKTLSYAGVFEFPLRLEEIYQRLIGEKSSQEKIKKELQALKLNSFKGFYYLGEKNKVTTRIKNQKYQKEKLKIAKKIAKTLKIFPSIKAILVTGAVAAKNSTKDDDIDFLIITKPRTLWITRLLTNIYLDTKKLRRKKYANKVKDLACLNLWLTTKSLSIPKNRQNLYTAYEITLAKPLWDKDQTYQNFLYQNRWVQKFLPNTIIPKKPTKTTKPNCLGIINYIFFILQSLYMKPNQTNESISTEFAFFHPRNTRQEIEKKYHIILKQYKNL